MRTPAAACRRPRGAGHGWETDSAPRCLIQSDSSLARLAALGVQMDELERVLEREGREFARGVLRHPQRAALDRLRKRTEAWGCAVTNICSQLLASSSTPA